MSARLSYQEEKDEDKQHKPIDIVDFIAPDRSVNKVSAVVGKNIMSQSPYTA